MSENETATPIYELYMCLIKTETLTNAAVEK